MSNNNNNNSKAPKTTVQPETNKPAYTTREVYVARNFAGRRTSYTAFLFPGFAKDETDDKVFKNLLHLSSEDQEELDEAIENAKRCNQYRTLYRRVYTNWEHNTKYYGDLYWSREAAELVVDGDKAGDKRPYKDDPSEDTLIEPISICIKDAPAIPENFQVILRKDENGKLFTHINTHPELVGRFAEGKLFFPDASWKDVEPGKANVTIKLEKDKYGFLVGENVLDKFANREQALDFLWNQDDAGTSRLFSYTNKKKGQTFYGYVSGDSHSEYLIIVSKDENGKEFVTRRIMGDEEAREFAERDEIVYNGVEFLYQVFARDSWGVTDRNEVNEIINWTESEFYDDRVASTKAARRTMIQWNYNSIWSEPKDELLNEAVKAGWVVPVSASELNGVQVYTTDLNRLFGAMVLSREEFEDLTSLISEANHQADVAIQKAAQKGKVRIIR